ncbi:MAG: hypothetical protein WCN98_10735 [Verrucomicrobiaceae bacterium]
MSPWGGPPSMGAWGRGQQKGGETPKGKGPEQKGGPQGRGFGSQGGMPPWGAPGQHPQKGGDAPKDNPKPDADKGGDHKGGHHHGALEEAGPQEEIRPAIRSGEDEIPQN